MSWEKEFETYFKRYYTPVGMYVLRMCRNTSDTEDIVQEAFSIIWQKAKENGLPENFRAYLYRVAHNLTIDSLRNNSIIDSSTSLEILQETIPSQEEIDTSERDAKLWQAIARLPERCREVFLLSKRDGLSNNQIADKLDISAKTVENQMTKAYKSLRGSLESRHGNVFFLPFL